MVLLRRGQGGRNKPAISPKFRGRSVEKPVKVMISRVVMIRRNIITLIWMRWRVKIRRPHQWIDDSPWNLRRCRRGRSRRERGHLLLVLVVHRWSVQHGRHLLLLLLLPKIVIVPSPFLLQLGLEEIDLPSGFLVDFFEDRDDFSLLGYVGETFGSDGDAAKGSTCYTAASN